MVRPAKGKMWRGPLLVLLLGMALGVAAKWLDFHSDLWGTLFSGISVWVLLASVVALYSQTPRRAALHAALLLGGMVAAYYASAEAMGGVWSQTFLVGWGLAALASPIPGYLVWFARERSVRGAVLRIGVLGFQLVATVVLFEKLRVSDGIIILLTAVLLRRGMEKPAPGENGFYKEIDDKRREGNGRQG